MELWKIWGICGRIRFMGGNTEKVIDIKENQLLKIDQELLEILLQDKTTGKNIIWATDNYISHGDSFW